MTEKAQPMVTQNSDGSTTHSFKIDDLSDEQLEQILNLHQRQRDELREKCIYLRRKLDARIEARRRAALQEQIDRLQAEMHGGNAATDAVAPGALIEVQASSSSTPPATS